MPRRRKPRKCGCVNHLGKPKIQHASKEAAVEMILRRYMKHGAHEVYPCPNKEGVFHVRSIRQHIG